MKLKEERVLIGKAKLTLSPKYGHPARSPNHDFQLVSFSNNISCWHHSLSCWQVKTLAVLEVKVLIWTARSLFPAMLWHHRVKVCLLEHDTVDKLRRAEASLRVPDLPTLAPQRVFAQLIWMLAIAIAPGPHERKIADFTLRAVFWFGDTHAVINAPLFRVIADFLRDVAILQSDDTGALFPIENGRVVTCELVAAAIGILELSSVIELHHGHLFSKRTHAQDCCNTDCFHIFFLNAFIFKLLSSL